MAGLKENGGRWRDLYGDCMQITDRTPSTLREMIEAGANVYAEETRSACDRYGIDDTGALKRSIKHGKIMRHGDGYRVEVWPQGTRTDKKHPNGERNETIGFIIEYGKADVPARPFMAAAAMAAEYKAADAMRRILEGISG